MPLDQVIYRKYRSKTFKEVLSQDNVVEILVKSILNDRVSHAYLFAGPRGTGKTTLARLLAKAINCENFKESGDVCNNCPMCNSIDNYSATDIIELDAASNRGIEEIRSLKESINYSPTILKKKVYIIDEAHMLTKEAFNALLKTLEEPPNHVVFILATTESHKLPITILSRVERYDLSLASEEKIIEKLKYITEKEGIDIDNDVLKIIYKKSGGSFRDSESLLSKLINISTDESQKISKDKVYEVLGQISDDLIDSFIESLKLRSLEGSLENYKNLKNKGYTPVLILDNILDRCRELIVLNLKEASKLIPIITFVINTRVLIKDFLDKDLLVTLEITKYCVKDDSSNEGRGDNEKSKSKNVKSNDDLKTKDSNETKLNIEEKTQEKIEESNLDSVNINDLTNQLINLIIADYPKAKVVLNSSNVYLSNSTLFIETTHEMNFIYLNKQDLKNLIIKSLKIPNITIDSVNILHVDSLTQLPEVEKLVENKAPLEEDSKISEESFVEFAKEEDKKVEDNKKELEKASTLSVKIEVGDNSNLVEDMFNLI